MKLTTFTALALVSSFAGSATGADLNVSITNLTQGLYFTPLLVAAHQPESRLFWPGTMASESLQAMAEGGDIAGLGADLTAAGATISENPAAGLLGPAQTTMTNLNTDGSPDNGYLSVVAMILPTNDGFLGLNAIEIPEMPGTYTYYVNAYDAGSEANDEIRGSGAPGMPGFPAPGPIDESSGFNGTGVLTSAEGFVHIHRNVLGDNDLNGGNSDIVSTVHRWLNPVARVTVTVN